MAILQDSLPEAQCGPPSVPGVGPCEPDDWLRVDEAYAAQMALRAELLAGQRDKVLWMEPGAMDAALEVLDAALAILPALGFAVEPARVACPDGRAVSIARDDPLATLGHLVQEDICLLQKRGDEHVLTGAVLCFPAGWRLADKAGRPLTDIHVPVKQYDSDIARRVQRLFDGVRAGRPLWRFNRLGYADPALFQPVKGGQGPDAFIRSERQCILRLPQTQAVVFTIHTHVVRADQTFAKV